MPSGSTGGITISLSEAPIGSAEWLPQGLPEGAGPAAIGVADAEAAVDASALDTGLEGIEPERSALLFLSDAHGASPTTPARGNPKKISQQTQQCEHTATQNERKPGLHASE